MRIIIITQDEPFYLAENIEYLISILPDKAEVVGCVVSDVSPFGKIESFIAKAIKTRHIFGTLFFLRYAFKFILAKFNPKKKVHQVLARHDIPKVHISGSINSKQSMDNLNKLKPYLLISIAGNEIFRKPLIDLAPRGCLNLHTALLPKYRGLMPSFWVLKNQEAETGVSVFYVDEGIDSGPILVQKKIPLTGQSQSQLITLSKKMGMEAIAEAVTNIMRGKTGTIPNPDDEKSYYSFPTQDDIKEFRRIGARF